MSEIDKSFLALLYQKKAAVLRIQAEGVNCSAALSEVDRQIAQCIKGGNPIKGEGVTKSGKED